MCCKRALRGCHPLLAPTHAAPAEKCIHSPLQSVSCFPATATNTCHFSLQVQWHLMVASCFRRMGRLRQALAIYERIEADFPPNDECTPAMHQANPLTLHIQRTDTLFDCRAMPPHQVPVMSQGYARSLTQTQPSRQLQLLLLLHRHHMHHRG